MKLRNILLLAGLAVCCAGTVGATSLDVSLNDDSVQGQLFQPLSEDAYGTAQVGARLLYNDDDRTRLASGEIDFIGRPGGVPGLTAGVGAILWGGRFGEKHREADILSLGIGAKVGFAPPPLLGVGIDAKLFYGPKILTGADAERLFEGALRVSYALHTRARIFVEYQKIHADFEGGHDENIDNDVRLGFEANF